MADVDVRRAEIERRAAEYESLSDLGSIFGAAAVLAQDVPWLLARLKEHDERAKSLERETNETFVSSGGES